MEISKALAVRLREVFLDGQWIANTNYKHQIKDLDWQKATQKIGTLNSIASLIFHVNYYLAGILEVFNGGELLIRDQFAFDMPPITSEEDWVKMRSTFLDNAAMFAKEVMEMSDVQLASNFVDEKYGSYARNIEGVIEHAYYHLGQIAIIKKMFES